MSEVTKVIKLDTTNELTVSKLVEVCNQHNIPLDTKVSIMGADAKYIAVQDGCITIDEVNYTCEVCRKDDCTGCPCKTEE